MTVDAGSMPGPYEILAPIGAGGMGEEGSGTGRRMGGWPDTRGASDKDRKIQIGNVNGGERVNLTNTPGYEAAARFSPDSKWVAYSSEEAGRSEIYVRPFPGHADSSAARIQISDNGGEYPMLNETGAELYYLSAGDMVFAVNAHTLATGR